MNSDLLHPSFGTTWHQPSPPTPQKPSVLMSLRVQAFLKLCCTSRLGWGRKFLLQQTYQPKGSDLALDSWNLRVHLHFLRGKKKGCNFLYLSKRRHAISHRLKLNLGPWLPFPQQGMLSHNKSLLRTYPANKNHVKNTHHTEYLLPIATKYFYKQAALWNNPSYLEW